MTEEFHEYSLEYTHQGKRWSVNIQATSFEDAKERARALYYAEVGKVEMSIPAFPGTGLLVRAMCWVQNLVRGNR